MPHGRQLPEEEWARRHLAIRVLLLAHAVGLPVAARLFDGSVLQMVTYAAAMLLVWYVAGMSRLAPAVRSCVAASGLIMASSFLVQLTGGLIEAHFHFFVMVPVVAMYESWLPFCLAIAFVLFEHGIVGAIMPHSVYGHSEHSDPWLWAVVHAGFFAAACLGALVNWGFAERARRAGELMAAELAFKAEHDPLTGLPNPARLAAIAHERGGHRVVVALNLDRFRQVNDALGHGNADALLVEVARRLRTSLEPDDVLVRLGGDDFAAVTMSNGAQRPAEVAERLQKCFDTPFDLSGIEVDVDVTIGVAGNPDATVSELQRHAELAMRTAKEHRTGVHVYRAQEGPRASQELALFTELRRAINEGQLELFYQPKIDLSRRAIIGAEALVRWRHPDRGLVPPGDFLPLAENTSLYRPLTTAVLQLALQQIHELDQADHALPIAINVSPRSLHDTGFADEILTAVRRAGVDPSLLRIEITETSVMADPAVAASLLTRLSSNGLGLSIDDFGTGHSSLSMLRSLPVDELKIDRSFVSRLTAGEHNDVVLVQATIQLGHLLGMTVIAEGIETERELTLLTEMGCDLGQGYHIARPMPAADFMKLVTGNGSAPKVPGQRAAAPRPEALSTVVE